MTFIYTDESIHTRGDFIVTAAVYSAVPLDEIVFGALQEHGFRPQLDEFKSSMTMAGNPAGQALRDRLRFLLMEQCKVAVAICPLTERDELTAYILHLLQQLNTDDSIQPGLVFFDQGMKRPSAKLLRGWTLRSGCDSRQVGGIQLADCAAHIISIILMSEMGIINKMVPAGEFYPEPEVEMAWQLWTSLRYALSSSIPVDGYDADGWCEPMMKPFGLLVSPRCSDAVRAAAEARLSEVWVGCIH